MRQKVTQKDGDIIVEDFLPDRVRFYRLRNARITRVVTPYDEDDDDESAWRRFLDFARSEHLEIDEAKNEAYLSAERILGLYSFRLSCDKVEAMDLDSPNDRCPNCGHDTVALRVHATYRAKIDADNEVYRLQEGPPVTRWRNARVQCAECGCEVVPGTSMMASAKWKIVEDG